MRNANAEKAVILARGLGTRMRKEDASVALDESQAAIAASGVKAMLRIKRPFLDYVLHVLADAGYHDVCLVIGPEHTQVRDYYEGLKSQRVRISFAIQEKPLGTANAVAAAESFAGKSSILVLNSDNFYPQDACAGLRGLSGSGFAAFERDSLIRGSNIPAERIMKFAAAEIGADGLLKRILEKPDEATLARLGTPLYVSMNCWMFRPVIFEACRKIGLSPRGEYEVTDAVQYAIDHLHEPFHAVKTYSPVLDLSSRNDIAGVTQRLSDMEVNL